MPFKGRGRSVMPRSPLVDAVMLADPILSLRYGYALRYLPRNEDIWHQRDQVAKMRSAWGCC